MVVLSVKRNEEPLFLHTTTCGVSLANLLPELTQIHNMRLKLDRLCTAAEQLSEHGISLPPNMVGLTDDQVSELKLVDDWAAKCEPSGGGVSNPDPIGKRGGNAPNMAMRGVIMKTVGDAKALLSKSQIDNRVHVTMAMLTEAYESIRGATMIVYPMGLPSHDEVREIFDDNEDLTGRQVGKLVLSEADAQLWWAGKEMQREKSLGDYIGKNEKTKIVVKMQKRGAGAPSREPVVSEQQQREMMAFYHKKQETFKKLEADNEDNYMNAEWANPSSLKQSLHGTGNISFRMR